jgi:hypothetical protein
LPAHLEPQFVAEDVREHPADRRALCRLG